MIFKHISKLSDWNETQFTNKLRDAIAAFGGYSIKLGASQFMQCGTPDTFVTIGGSSFLLESKVHPNKASPIQNRVIRDIRDSGGHAWIITLKGNSIIVDDQVFDNFIDMLKFMWSSTEKKEPEWTQVSIK